MAWSGAVLGAALGVALQRALPALLRDWLPFPVEFVIAWPAVGRGMVAGLVICILFTLFPLLAVRRVPPLAGLRSGSDDAVPPADPLAPRPRGPDRAGGDRFTWAKCTAAGRGLPSLASWRWGSASWPGWRGSMAAAARRRPARRLPYTVRQGIANLHRPNNRTVLLLVSLGLGTFLILTLYLARSTLLREVAGVDGQASGPTSSFSTSRTTRWGR